jgi:glycosyltransferase involved in cell wall biosynthesis
MRILHVIPFFTPALGGPVIVLEHLAKELARRGHQITILTTDYRFDQSYAKLVEAAGVTVLPFHCVFNVGLLLYSPAIKRWMKTHLQRFDIIHLHDYRSYQNNVAARFATMRGTPCILQPHNSMPRMVSKRALKWLYDAFYSNKLMQATTQLIAVSKQEVACSARKGFDLNKIALIYMGIDSNVAPKSLPKKGTFKAKYDISERIILYLGRLHKSKGIDTLIRAFFELTKQIDNVVLVIIGSDEGYRSKLEELTDKLHLRERVRFIGYVDGYDKTCAYADAEVFVHAVQYMGGVGLTPLEAICCGAPVIVTKQCGEVIEEAGCGYIVDYGDVADLNRKIVTLLENPNLREEMVRRGQTYVRQNLSWAAIAERIESIYEDCLCDV